MTYKGFTKSEISAAANDYADGEEWRGAPVLSATSTKKILLQWLEYLGDSEIDSSLNTDDAWATLAANVGGKRSEKKTENDLVMGRLPKR